MSDLNEYVPVSNTGAVNNNVYVATPPYPSEDLVKKVGVTRLMIEQLGELDRQAQISVIRAVSAFFEIESEVGT